MTKIKKEALMELLIVDDIKISKREAITEFRAMRQYFYRHGRSEEDIVKIIEEKLPEATIISKGDKHTTFRGGDSVYKSSHFYVIFTMKNK